MPEEGKTEHGVDVSMEWKQKTICKEKTGYKFY